jgi:hypothetical protein
VVKVKERVEFRLSHVWVCLEVVSGVEKGGRVELPVVTDEEVVDSGADQTRETSQIVAAIPARIEECRAGNCWIQAQGPQAFKPTTGSKHGTALHPPSPN